MGVEEEFEAVVLSYSVFLIICVLTRYFGKLEEKAVFQHLCFELLIVAWKLNVKPLNANTLFVCLFSVIF